MGVPERVIDRALEPLFSFEVRLGVVVEFAQYVREGRDSRSTGLSGGKIVDDPDQAAVILIDQAAIDRHLFAPNDEHDTSPSTVESGCRDHARLPVCVVDPGQYPS